MPNVVLHKSDPDADGYSRVVFLDPVGGLDAEEAVVIVATLSEALPATPVYNPVTNSMDTPEITEVSVVAHGQREFLLAGKIASIKCGDDVVWSAAKPKDSSTGTGEPGTK